MMLRNVVITIFILCLSNQIAGINLFVVQNVPPGYDTVTHTITLGPIPASAHGTTIILDTASVVRGSHNWFFVTDPGDSRIPLWNGPISFTVDASLNISAASPPTMRFYDGHREDVKSAGVKQPLRE